MDWVIVPARTLAPGDVVRPINSCGPLAEVTEVGRREFRAVPLDPPVHDPSTRLRPRETDEVNRRAGWVPRLRRAGETVG